MKTIGLVLMVGSVACAFAVFMLQYGHYGFSGGFYTPSRTTIEGSMRIVDPPSGILVYYWPCFVAVLLFAWGLIMFLSARRERSGKQQTEQGSPAEAGRSKPK